MKMESLRKVKYLRYRKFSGRLPNCFEKHTFFWIKEIQFCLLKYIEYLGITWRTLWLKW